MTRLGRLPCGAIDGWLYIPVDDERADGFHPYQGVRTKTFVDPDDGERVVVFLLGGLADMPGFITDGLAFSLSVDGLRALGADLIATADEMAQRLGDAAGP